MTQNEIIKKLLQGFSTHDRELFIAAATELIQEEKNKKNNRLAKELEKILQTGYSKTWPVNNAPEKNYPEIPKNKESGLPLVSVKEFELTWHDVVLSETNVDILRQVILENKNKELLGSYWLQPKSKLLFCGPPGCGKTLTAKVLASVLEIPLVYVDLTAVFSSYLGETATNLKKIFDYIEKGKWVVLFDEFDAIARDRDIFNEHGEIKRLVNSLLQLIDSSSSNNLFIATTNHESLLDRAIWRRFDEVIFFGKLDVKLRAAVFNRYLSSIPHSNVNIEKVAADLDTATGADIERICNDAIKTVLIRGDKQLSQADLEAAVAHYLERNRIITSSIENFKAN